MSVSVILCQRSMTKIVKEGEWSVWMRCLIWRSSSWSLKKSKSASFEWIFKTFSWRFLDSDIWPGGDYSNKKSTNDWSGKSVWTLALIKPLLVLLISPDTLLKMPKAMPKAILLNETCLEWTVYGACTDRNILKRRHCLLSFTGYWDLSRAVFPISLSGML